MESTTNTVPLSVGHRSTAAVLSRLRGPGGFYNMGNLLGLVAGLAVHVVSARAGGATALGAAYDHLAGSPSALALTGAMLIFFWSGELYHRAWAHGAPPDRALNRRGDLLSGVGALLLGVGLLILGHPVLAATAGLLHALGKFGSAFAGGRGLPFWPAGWADPWRSAVLASRMPALFAAVISLAQLSGSAQGAAFLLASITPLTLVLCYLLWIKADLMLFRS